MGDLLVSDGYLAAGYNTISLDDCIVDMAGRDPTTNELRADPVRFPSGFKAMGDYLHNRSLLFGFYTAESTTTCGGYPGSRGFESLDAATFASWGVGELSTKIICWALSTTQRFVPAMVNDQRFQRVHPLFSHHAGHSRGHACRAPAHASKKARRANLLMYLPAHASRPDAQTSMS